MRRDNLKRLERLIDRLKGAIYTSADAHDLRWEIVSALSIVAEELARLRERGKD